VAVRVIAVPAAKLAVQVLPQLMPDGEDVTVPPPVPPLLVVKVYWITSKLAVTDLAASTVTMHVPVPVHAPDQPANCDVPSGVAVRVTWVPVVKPAAQVLPQSMPDGEEVTVPVPPFMPFLLIVKTSRSKLAVTDLAASMVTMQVAVPVHAPDQPVKLEAPSGVAVRVTTVPTVNPAVQVLPQLMPNGEEVTVPVPPFMPFLLTSKLVVPDAPPTGASREGRAVSGGDGRSGDASRIAGTSREGGAVSGGKS
jgi:hypothetical protein